MKTLECSQENNDKLHLFRKSPNHFIHWRDREVKIVPPILVKVILPNHLNETQAILRMQKSFGVYRFVKATSDYTLELKFPILLCLHLITHKCGFTWSCPRLSSLAGW